MKNLAFTAPNHFDTGACAQALGNHSLGFRACARTAVVKATIIGDNRVLPFCGTHAKAPNVTILETLGSPKPKRTAILKCCSTGHTWPRKPIADDRIIGAVRASIAYCDARFSCKFAVQDGKDPCARCKRYAAAADRLRDFATVELLCEGLGITRKELN